MTSNVLSSLGTGARVGCALASLAVTASLVAGLLGVFHAQSPARWLTPTPDVLELAEACQALPGRTERLQCTQRVVTVTLARHARGTVLASNP